MAIGSFSSQLQQQQQQYSQTRTQRLQSQQQNDIEKARFEASRKEAERLGETFTDRTVEEKYYEYVPREYVDRYGNIIKSWYRYRQSERDSILRGTSANNRVAFERTRTTTVPFTYENYQQEYAKLSPDVQQFFVSPTEIKLQADKKMQEGIVKVDARISDLKQKIEDKSSAIERWQREFQSLNASDRDARRKYYADEIDRMRMQQRQYQEEINQLSEGKGKVAEGYAVQDVMEYAQDVVYMQQEKSNATKMANIQFNAQVQAGNIDKKWAGNISGYNKWVTAQNIRNKYVQKTQIAEFQQKYPQEVLTFDEQGNVKYIKSKQFGKILTPEQYNAKVEEWSKVDTGLTLGEKKKDYVPPLSIGVWKPFTEEEMAESRRIIPTNIGKILDWAKKTGISIFPSKEALPPPEYELISVPSSKIGEGMTTMNVTRKKTIYGEEYEKAKLNQEKTSEEVFKEYSKNLSELETYSQEKVDVLKSDAQKKFNEQIAVIDKDFQASFDTRTEKAKREKKWAVEELLGDTLAHPITSQRKIKYLAEDLQKTWALGTPAYTYHKTILTAPNIIGGESLTANVKIEEVLVPEIKPRKAPLLFKEQTEEEKTKEFIEIEKRYKLGVTGWGKDYSSAFAREVMYAKEMGKEDIQGIWETFYEKPLTTGMDTMIWAEVMAGATIVSSYTGGLGGLATSKAMKWAGRGLLTLYGGSIIVRTSMQPTAHERGKKLGEITAGEIFPMLAGGLAGTYIGTKVSAGIDYAYYKTLQYQILKKYKFLRDYKTTEMDILRGEKRFVEINPFNKNAQMRAFTKLDKNFLTPDERAIMKTAEGYLRIGTHATTSRMDFLKEKTIIKPIGREMNAMSIANQKWSINFFDMMKKSKYSLYSGQAIPTANLPLGLRIDVQGFAKLPSRYKPTFSIKELETILGKKINPKYYKEMAWLVEKGEFGTGYAGGFKPEVENYLKGFGFLQRTAKTPYFTQYANKEFYQKLEGFLRKGYQEYAFRVEKFSLTKPDTWIDKILGRQAGRFKPMTKGRVVPLQRFEALATGDKNLAQQIKLLLATKPKAEVVKILTDKQIMQTAQSSYSSVKTPFTLSASYPSSYAFLLSSLISKPSKTKYPSISYPKSYPKSPSSSALRSAVSSLLSTSKASKSSISKLGSYGLSPSKMSYLKSLLYEMPSYPKTPRYNIPSIKTGLAGKIKKMRKRKVSPEFKALFPDFTARSIGLKPKEVSLKQALKEIAKIQTGFSVRTGLRLKGYKPIDEKSLLVGIMK